MTDKQIRHSLQKAVQTFRIAEKELYRPSKDVVALCACRKMRDSVNEFLHIFLMSKTYGTDYKKYFDDLLGQCAEIDAQFKVIDLSCFLCSCSQNHFQNCDDKYCLSNEKINECFIRAIMVKNLVLAKLNVTEKELDDFFLPHNALSASSFSQ